MNLCAHLQPLVEAMREAGLTLWPISSPYGGGGDMKWWACNCTFDEDALRARLQLDPALRYVEYNGMASGADASWKCREHDMVLMGPHPGFASNDTPHLR